MICGGVFGLSTGFGGLVGLGDSTSGALIVAARGGGVTGRGFGFSFGLGFGLAVGVSSIYGTGSSGILSAESLGALTGDLFGEARFTGSPVRACSNMEMRFPVGGIDPESTTSPLCDEARVRTLGLGLALRLAANVAAMKLALLASVFPAEPGCS